MFDDLKQKYEIARAYQANQAQTIIGAGIKYYKFPNLSTCIRNSHLDHNSCVFTSTRGSPNPNLGKTKWCEYKCDKHICSEHGKFLGFPSVVFNPSLKTPDSTIIHETCSCNLDSTSSFCDTFSSKQIPVVQHASTYRSGFA